MSEIGKENDYLDDASIYYTKEEKHKKRIEDVIIHFIKRIHIDSFFFIVFCLCNDLVYLLSWLFVKKIRDNNYVIVYDTDILVMISIPILFATIYLLLMNKKCNRLGMYTTFLMTTVIQIAVFFLKENFGISIAVIIGVFAVWVIWIFLLKKIVNDINSKLINNNDNYDLKTINTYYKKKMDSLEQNEDISDEDKKVKIESLLEERKNALTGVMAYSPDEVTSEIKNNGIKDNICWTLIYLNVVLIIFISFNDWIYKLLFVIAMVLIRLITRNLEK